ncbi:MAG: hypothetical protein ACP5NF_05315 [Thermoanaerobaculum sp.]
MKNTAQFRTLFAAGTWKPYESLELQGEVGYTRASEMMGQILFNVSEEILAKLHDSNYDLSEAHTYSNLDSKRWDVNLSARARLAKGIHGVVSYNLVKYDDVTPYLADLSGRLDVFQVGLRWTL